MFLPDFNVVAHGRGITSTVTEVTTPRAPKETRANCNGDHPFAFGVCASMVTTWPSGPMMLNAEAVSAKIGTLMVAP